MPRLDDADPAAADDADPGSGLARSPADLRMPLLAVAAWAGALLGLRVPVAVAVAGLGATVVVLLAVAGRRGRPGTVALVLAGGLVAAGVLVSALVRADAVASSPVAALAGEGAAVEVVGVLVSDPRVVESRFGGDQVVVRLEVREVVGRGWRHRVSVPVVVLGDEAWAGRPLGATVRSTGRLAPADEGDQDVAGLLTGASPPEQLTEPDVWWRAAGAVRASIRDAVAHRPPEQAALVPALVDGDDAALPPDLVADFQTTGLTHDTTH